MTTTDESTPPAILSALEDLCYDISLLSDVIAQLTTLDPALPPFMSLPPDTVKH